VWSHGDGAPNREHVRRVPFSDRVVSRIDSVRGGGDRIGLDLRARHGSDRLRLEVSVCRFDDYLEAVKKVWSGEVVEHESEFLSWHGFKSYPIPVQKPHPPILIGGTTTKTLQRVVNAADGWYAPSDSQQELTEKIAELKEMAAQAGRPFESIDITTNWRTAKYPDALPQLEELGITRAVALLGATGESDPRKEIDLIASRAGL
jgi:hypothetical protein